MKPGCRFVVAILITIASAPACNGNGFLADLAGTAVKAGLSGFVRGAANEGGAVFGGKVVQHFTSDGNPGDINSLKQRLNQLELDAGVYAELVKKLNDSIDQKTTKIEFEAKVSQVLKEIANLEAKQAEIELRLSQRIGKVEEQTYLNQRYIEGVAAAQRQLRKELELSVARLDQQLAVLSVDLKSDQTERKKADEIQRTDIAELRGDVARLFSMISPNTRAHTAARLGADAALMIVANGDNLDAIRMLRLSLAYDKSVQKHDDPAARYWLAIAYRRANLNERAEEMLAESIVAERHRVYPAWHHKINEKFQNSDRNWAESRRTDARFGVRAPRSVFTVSEDDIPKSHSGAGAVDSIESGATSNTQQ